MSIAGREAVAEALQTLRERTGGTFHSELIDLLVSASRSSPWFRTPAAAVNGCSIRGRRFSSRAEQGRIAEIWIYVDDLYAVDAFWS